jgi:hypothetical protein
MQPVIPFHPVQTAACCAVARNWVLNIFSSKTPLTWECYLGTVHEFLEHHTEEETAEAWFQQDGVTLQSTEGYARANFVVRRSII